jgi:lipopolysaccharide cholinephosphotransferase
MIRLGSNFIRAKEISSLIKTKFEDTETFIPVGYDGYLKRRYGNYMQLPPEHKQKGHHSDSNHMQGDYTSLPKKEINFIAIPDPFTPCEHKEILHWKNKKQLSAGR